MRIHFFANLYPAPYKPYYDAQFADFIARGHDVRIFAASKDQRSLTDKVVRFQLDRRTSYFPSTLRSLPGRIGPVLNGLLRPRAVRHALRAFGHHPLRRSLAESARILSVTRQPPDLCFVHGLSTAVMLPFLRAVYPNTPTVMYYHGGEVPSSNRVLEAQAVQVFQIMDRVFTNTESSRQQAIERGCPSEKIVVVPVGVDVDDFRPPATRTYRRDGVLRLVSAGRVSEEKGLIFALQAIKALVQTGSRNIHYSILGDGYALADLQAFVQTEGLAPHIVFRGTLTPSEVIVAMGEADALLLPSIEVGTAIETQACSVQEAMLMKTIPITTVVGGVPESIPPDVKPFTAAPRDVDGLARAIRSLQALPDEQLERLGILCREFVLQRYDVRVLNDRILATSLASTSATSAPALAN